jgi:hypothetical protein
MKGGTSGRQTDPRDFRLRLSSEVDHVTEPFTPIPVESGEVPAQPEPEVVPGPLELSHGVLHATWQRHLLAHLRWNS